VLWDTVEDTIVNNESREILRMLTTAFDDLGDDVSLLPDDPAVRDRVDEVITDIYEPINNGVYRAGFATSQAAYDEAIDDLFAALDRWNDHLADQRYLVGDTLTEADLCLFTTLVRFDQVYHTTPTTLRKVQEEVTEPRYPDWKQLNDIPNVYAYLRDLYQTDGFKQTTRFDHIGEHYGCPGSPHGMDPKSLPADELSNRLLAPHDRD
jgi:putative glutathione S-transferase